MPDRLATALGALLVLLPFWSALVSTWMKSASVARLGHRYRHLFYSGFWFEDVSDARVFICIMSGFMLLLSASGYVWIVASA